MGTMRSAGVSPSTIYMPAHYTGATTADGFKWHYTTGRCFLQIVADGVIHPATAYVPPGERPIVWFSTNPIWEPTACKGIRVPGGPPRTATFAEMVTLDHGLVRFGVHAATAPHAFQALVRKSRMGHAIAKGLRRHGRELGADPRHWWGTFRPVEAAQWAAIEVWEEDHWVRLQPTPDRPGETACPHGTTGR